MPDPYQQYLDDYISTGRHHVPLDTLFNDLFPDNKIPTQGLSYLYIKSLGLRGLQILGDGAALFLAYQSPLTFLLTVPVAYVLTYPEGTNLRTNIDIQLIDSFIEHTQAPSVTAWSKEKQQIIELATQQIKQQDRIGDVYNWPISNKVDILALQQSLAKLK